MKKLYVTNCLLVTFCMATLIACKKDGLNSANAKQIQYRWERFSTATQTNYFDGRALYWTVNPTPPGNYTEFNSDGYFYTGTASYTTKYQYKVDGDKILSLLAPPSRPTTPQYTDTAIIRKVDDHLLVLYRRYYYISGAYIQLNETLDSLKR